MSAASTVVIRNRSSSTPWVANTLALNGRHNLRLVFDESIFLLAKRDTPEHCESASMFVISNSSNITIEGVLRRPRSGEPTKPTIRGWKWDHLNNTWGCGAWLHPVVPCHCHSAPPHDSFHEGALIHVKRGGGRGGGGTSAE